MSHEIKSAIEEFSDEVKSFKAETDRRLKKQTDALDLAHARIEQLSALGVTERRSSGHGWLDVKAVVTSSDPAGGYLVADELSNVFLDALRPASVLLRAGAQTFQMSGASLSFPGATSDPAAVWRGEGESLTSGDPAYRRVRAVAKKLQSFVVCSNESLSDSRPEIARILEGQMAASLGLGLDHAVFGVGQQVNALAAPSRFADVEGHQTADTLGVDGDVPEDLSWLAEAIGLLLQANGRLESSALFVSPRTLQSLIEINDQTDSVRPLLWSNTTLDGAPLARLMGIPMYVSSVLPDTLTQGNSSGIASSAWLIDMRAIMVCIRTGTRIEVDRSRFFDSDQTALRATLRGDVVAAYPELLVEIPGFLVS